MVKKDYSILINNLGQYQVNDIVIKQEIFDKELFEYDIRERDDMIEHLIDWISETKNSDKELMKEDLKYLITLKDDYIFSSIMTNEYIAKSDDEEEFNALCEELLKMNESIIKL